MRLRAPCCEQRVDQRDRHAAEPEPADGERGAVGDVGDGLRGGRDDLVHAQPLPSVGTRGGPRIVLSGCRPRSHRLEGPTYGGHRGQAGRQLGRAHGQPSAGRAPSGRYDVDVVAQLPGQPQAHAAAGQVLAVRGTVAGERVVPPGAAVADRADDAVGRRSTAAGSTGRPPCRSALDVISSTASRKSSDQVPSAGTPSRARRRRRAAGRRSRRRPWRARRRRGVLQRFVRHRAASAGSRRARRSAVALRGPARVATCGVGLPRRLQHRSGQARVSNTHRPHSGQPARASLMTASYRCHSSQSPLGGAEVDLADDPHPAGALGRPLLGQPAEGGDRGGCAGAVDVAPLEHVHAADRRRPPRASTSAVAGAGRDHGGVAVREPVEQERRRRPPRAGRRSRRTGRRGG